IDRWVARVDVITFYLPWYAHLGEALRHLDVPGWNPFVFSGTPFAGDPQSGWAYLPAMFAFTLFSPIPAMKVFAIIHLLVGGLSTYALARVLGMGTTPALVAGTAFAFGPFLTHNTTCCTIMSQIAPWVPLAFLGVELSLRAQTWTGRGLAWWLTGLAISQMLAGWIGQGAYNGVLAVGSYLAYRTLIDGPHPPAPSPDRGRGGARRVVSPLPRKGEGLGVRAGQALIHAAGIFGFGFLLGAAGVLIRLDVNSATNLAGGAYDEVTDRGTPPWDVLGMLGRILSLDNSNLKFYLGGATFALAILAPLIARRRYAVPYFAVYTAVILTLTLKTTPLHRLFYLLPEYRSLHEHSAYRIVGLLWVGPAILAGATVACWTQRAHRPWAIAAAAAPLLVVISIRDALGDGSGTIHDRTVWVVAAVSGLLALAAVLSQPRVRARLPGDVPLGSVLSVLLLALVVWDPTGHLVADTIGAHGAGTSLRAKMELLAGTTDPGGAGEFLQARMRQGETFRYFGYDGAGLRTADQDGLTYHARRLDPLIERLLVSARGMRLGLQDVQGYNPIQLARYVTTIAAINGGVRQDYHDANILPSGVNSSLLDLLNVRYVVIPNDVPADRSRPDLSSLVGATREVFRNDRIRVLERPSALPRAWIVHDARQVEPGASLDLLATGGIDPRTTALLEGSPPPLAEPADAAADAVTVTRAEADTIRLDARTDADGLLVISEVYDAGWHAYVDGKRVPIYAADHVLRAVPLPAGSHVVEVRYEPASLRIGLWLTGAGIVAGLVLLGLAGWQRWTARRSAHV
ncbi:MAG TPA: YfhO family protein, partial [Thermomicrobiales bacterium]